MLKLEEHLTADLKETVCESVHKTLLGVGRNRAGAVQSL
jgi:hypothetical protein